ncbi:prolyl oligopeptidase family serine peptidase, partial [Microbacterium oxydans]|uniref:prolyl oligopeptidase family serine peptidase n=1 Tax=Microbacterium oxydans TaxID=82380 RepID=UPI0024AE0FC8
MSSSPYGSWSSPFSAASVAASSPRIDGARFVGSEIWWGESVPAEKGRVTVRSSSGAEVLPSPWSARSRVHEYGGGAWTADEHGTLYFVDAKDQRVHRLSVGGEPVALTPPGPSHGGLRVQSGRLLAVREDLSRTPHLRAIIEIPLDGSAAEDASAITVIVQGDGFFAHPALSPDGTRAAWVAWDRGCMPWEDAHVQVAEVGEDSPRTIPSRAALQPEWLSDSELLFADDPGGRWALHRISLDWGVSVGTAREVSPSDADTGYGLWVLGNRWYQPLDDGRVVAVRTNGRDEVVMIDTDDAADGRVDVISFPGDGHVSVDDVDGTRVLLSGNGSRANAGLWCVDVVSGATVAVRGGEPVDPQWMPAAMPIEVEGPHGEVHAFAYPPANPHATAPDHDLPPYIVLVHGGPTAHVTGAASEAIAFYTSRGIGVLDVNYGGSTGYGRSYRERLDGQWGIVDVDDVIAAARGLADAGLGAPPPGAGRGGGGRGGGGG